MRSKTKVHRKWPLMVSVVALGFAAKTMAGQDSAVILGGGRVGSWSTVGFVANASSGGIRLTVQPFEGPCPAACIIPEARLPAHGSLSLENVLAISPDAAATFETFYLTAFPASSAGSIASVLDVGARFVDQLHPGRSVDIPVVLLSRLEAANPSTLNFGGVTHGGSSQSNLVLGNIARTSTISDDLPVTLELFDSSGSLVGSGSLTVPYRETALIGDVVSYLGASPLSLGQLRVSRTGGGALMWGILYTVDSNGAVTSSAGARLSP